MNNEEAVAKPDLLPEMQELPSATLPTGEQYYVVGSQAVVSGAIKILEKFGFDTFRKLH